MASGASQRLSEGLEVVLFIAGRPLAFELLQSRIASRFPEVKGINQLSSTPAPLLNLR